MWLECAVEETDERGRKTRTTGARDNRRGIPQGSPISPLLANLYMRRFVLGWKMLGLERSLGSRIVTHADDLVILCRRGKDEEALARMRQLMAKLKLTVNEEKTRSCKVPEGEFNFLGYTFAQFCAATFLIRAWLRWVTGCPADRAAGAAGPPQTAYKSARLPADSESGRFCCKSRK